MATAERENVLCVYCDRVMGWIGSELLINQKTHRRERVVTMQDNPDLPPVCETSPNSLHANMPQEQAKARGFL